MASANHRRPGPPHHFPFEGETKITKIVERNQFNTVVEVTLTVQTVIREGRDQPEMFFNGKPIKDAEFINAVHEALDDDWALESEMERICG